MGRTNRSASEQLSKVCSTNMAAFPHDDQLRMDLISVLCEIEACICKGNPEASRSSLQSRLRQVIAEYKKRCQ